MMAGILRLFRWTVAAGLVLAIGPQSWAHAQIGRKISVKDYPSMKEGSPELVMIEATDFQCPYCGQGARELLPRVYENFVHTGKVELVYLSLPLQMHSQAFKAAQAAACAGDQQKFWEMHDTLFANQRALGSDQIPGYAEKLGLDMPVFQKCLAGGRHDGEIRNNVRIANGLGITGTPAYLLARRVPGGDKVEIVEIVHGDRPYEEMAKKLDALLATK
jgi:protein-disulfide isomerase